MQRHVLILLVSQVTTKMHEPRQNIEDVVDATDIAHETRVVTRLLNHVPTLIIFKSATWCPIRAMIASVTTAQQCVFFSLTLAKHTSMNVFATSILYVRVFRYVYNMNVWTGPKKHGIAANWKAPLRLKHSCQGSDGCCCILLATSYYTRTPTFTPFSLVLCRFEGELEVEKCVKLCHEIYSYTGNG